MRLFRIKSSKLCQSRHKVCTGDVTAHGRTIKGQEKYSEMYRYVVQCSALNYCRLKDPGHAQAEDIPRNCNRKGPLAENFKTLLRASREMCPVCFSFLLRRVVQGHGD